MNLVDLYLQRITLDYTEMNDINMKVLIGTTEICGIMAKICREMRRRDICVDCMLLNDVVFYDEFNEIYQNEKLKKYKKIYSRLSESKKNRQKLNILLWRMIEAIELVKLFVDSIRSYDCFIFLFSRSFFSSNPLLEKLLFFEYLTYKLLNKKVIVICCGTDSRPPYCGKYEGTKSGLYRSTKRIARKIHIIDRFATVIDTTSNAFFHIKPYIRYEVVGNLVEIEEIYTRDNKKETGSVSILHAPSASSYKGTEYICHVIEKLKDDGFDINLKLITGMTHIEVLKNMQEADLLVNELYSDYPMSMLDTEAAMNGLPTITCGYYADIYNGNLNTDKVPTVYCSPDELENNLRDLIIDANKRSELSEYAIKYVKKNYVSKSVVDRLLMIISGNISEKWYYDPSDSIYMWGAAVTKEDVKDRIEYLIDKHGIGGLYLNKNSNLINCYKKLYKEIKHNETENQCKRKRNPNMHKVHL